MSEKMKLRFEPPCERCGARLSTVVKLDGERRASLCIQCVNAWIEYVRNLEVYRQLRDNEAVLECYRHSVSLLSEESDMRLKWRTIYMCIDTCECELFRISGEWIKAIKEGTHASAGTLPK